MTNRELKLKMQNHDGKIFYEDWMAKNVKEADVWEQLRNCNLDSSALFDFYIDGNEFVLYPVHSYEVLRKAETVF